MDFDSWAVQCARDEDKETFIIVFANLAQGKILRTIHFDTEEELRTELKLMGQSDAKQDELILKAGSTPTSRPRRDVAQLYVWD